MKKISVVSPVYFEEKSIVEFYNRLKRVMQSLSGQYSHEIILVNDGSTDKSLEIMQELRTSDPNLTIIDLSRNFGHQIAITAGLDHADGDAVVVMDSDLQDPPEVILDFVKAWEDGAHVAYGKRKKREGESAFKLATAHYFYKILDGMSEVRIPRDTGDFRLMDKKAANALRAITEENRFIRGLVAWVGFNQVPVEYERDARYAGETKYTLKKMIKLATDGLLSFSDLPLRWVRRIGLFISLFSLASIVWILGSRIIFPDSAIQQGWTSLAILILFLGGVQLTAIGILGDYIGRIYKETKARPLYFIKEIYGNSKG